MRLVQSGPRHARVVIVGEAPTAADVEEGIPFIGGTGVMFNQMLDRSGIRRNDCFVTNICHIPAPKGEFGWFLTPAGQSDLIQGILQLKKDLAEIKPNLVIVLGANALKILTTKSPITDWRGSILPCTLVPGLKVIATIHPAAALRIWENKAIIETDLRRCAKEMLTPEIVYPARDLYLPDGESHYITRRVGLDWVATKEPVSVSEVVHDMAKAEYLAMDIECWQDDAGKWQLVCIGFSDHAGRALVLDARSSSQLLYARILCACPAQKVMQNGMFDYTVLTDNGIQVENFTWDTMIAHHSLFAESAGGDDEIAKLTGKKKTSVLRKGLAFQTSIYTKEPYYKADGKLWKQTNDLQIFWRYNALDCCVTREIRDVQAIEMEQFGVMGIFQLSMPQVFNMLRATKHGIRIDGATRDRMRAEISAKIVNMQKFVDDFAGGPLNVKSNPQMVQLLYDRLHLPRRKGKSGNLTADKDTLVELGTLSSNPVLHTIIMLRQQRDLIERYLDASISSDMRMRCSFDPTGTRSGRLSSRASLDGSGTNLQNQPEEMRQMFWSDPGTVFVYRDYSQAEARVVAYLARCRGLIELFEDPSRDVHTENAARIFGHSRAVHEKHGGPVTATQRYLAKRVVHACNYGMGPKRLVEVVNEDGATTGVRISLTQAKQLIDRYFMLYPEIVQNFWHEVERDLKYTRTLNTPFGRKRMFFGRWDDKLLREAYSYIPQSTCGDLGRIAWTNISSALDKRPELGGIVLLNVHDSILVQCNIDAAPEVINLMDNAMRIPITLQGATFYIPTDCQVGYNWGHASESNPQGLKEVD